MDRAFWNQKKTLITGHTGFKGSWLSLWLQKLGSEISGFSLRPPTHPSLFEVAHIEEGMSSIIGDIRNFENLQESLKKIQPEIIFHLAAQSLVRPSYQNPLETYATNVMGTANLLEAIRHTPSVRVVIIVTSDKCYENREWDWGYREVDPVGGYDPYSNSKGCAELITSAFRNSFFNPEEYPKHKVVIASARAGNVIGGGDWANDRLIPDILNGISKNETITIRNPKAIRPWQHVLEPLSGYLLLAEKLWKDGTKYSGAWNFGPNDEDAKPVAWIADKLVTFWGDKTTWTLDKNANPHEAHYLKLDCSKAKTHLGWKPRWNLEIALKEIVSWHKAYQSKLPMRDFTLQQINHFSEIFTA